MRAHLTPQIIDHLRDNVAGADEIRSLITVETLQRGVERMKESGGGAGGPVVREGSAAEGAEAAEHADGAVGGGHGVPAAEEVLQRFSHGQI